MPKKKNDTQKLVSDKGDLTDVIEGEETILKLSYSTDAFMIKVPKTTIDSAHGKIEKLRNSNKLTQSEKPQEIKDYIEGWVQKHMKPLRIIKEGEFDHDSGVFQLKLFSGYEEVMEQKKLEA